MSKFTEPMHALKPMRYATRRLTAGDLFHAAPKDVRLLEALGRAKRGRPIGELPPPPAAVVAAKAPAAATTAAPTEPETAAPAADPLDHDGDGKPGGSTKQTGNDVAELRKAYQAAFGKRPFNGWDAEELRRRIADAP